MSKALRARTALVGEALIATPLKIDVDPPEHTAPKDIGHRTLDIGHGMASDIEKSQIHSFKSRYLGHIFITSAGNVDDDESTFAGLCGDFSQHANGVRGFERGNNTFGL